MHRADDCTPACAAYCAGVAAFPVPANPEPRPLRAVTGHVYERGSHFEHLECGHVQPQRSDIYGHTNAYRRRCLSCRLLAHAVAEAWAWRMADDAARLGTRFDADGNDPVDWSDPTTRPPDSAQSRRDARAGAETLRRNFRRTSRGYITVVRDADWLEHALRYVREINNTPDLLAYVAGRAHAAAIRAVPALRGEP